MLKKIMIVNHGLKEVDNDLDIIKLKHPKSNELRSFLLISDELFELVSLGQDGSSLFVDDFVQSDFQCVLATKFDLKYLLISLCARNSNDYASIESLKEILLEQTSSNNNSIKNLKVDGDLSVLFDVRKIKEKVEIKYNEEKCLDFLKKKVEILQTYLEKTNNSNEKQQKDNQEKNKTEAFELICQYVDPMLVSPLRKYLGLSSPFESSENHKRSKTTETVTLD